MQKILKGKEKVYKVKSYDRGSHISELSSWNGRKTKMRNKKIWPQREERLKLKRHILEMQSRKQVISSGMIDNRIGIVRKSDKIKM